MTDDNDTVMQPPDDDDQAAAPDDGRDWRQAYLQEVAQSRRYRQRAQQAEARTISDEQAAQLDRLGGLADEVEGKDRRIAVLEGAVRQMAGLGELTRALAACGVGSGCPHGDRMLDQASSLLADRVSETYRAAWVHENQRDWRKAYELFRKVRNMLPVHEEPGAEKGHLVFRNVLNHISYILKNLLEKKRR